MKWILTIAFSFFILLSPPQSWAQDDFFEAEMENESSDEMSRDELSDEEELDFETDDFVESGDSSQDDEADLDQAQNNTPADGVGSDNSAEEEIDVTASEIESTLKGEEESSQKNELGFQPASSYRTFRRDQYQWSAFIHFGYQFANVTEGFAQSTSLDNLPHEYSNLGVNILKKMPNKPYVFGGKFQVLTENITSSTLKAEYSMNLLTGFVGYNFIDEAVSVSATLGLVYPMSSSLILSTPSGSTSTELEYKIGFSYSVGVISVIPLKQFLIGFDGGLLFLQGQSIDSVDIMSEPGGYLNFLVGLGF